MRVQAVVLKMRCSPPTTIAKIKNMSAKHITDEGVNTILGQSGNASSYPWVSIWLPPKAVSVNCHQRDDKVVTGAFFVIAAGSGNSL